ncbi:hypothetical protein IFM89_013925 [Coptis chinensis]|uniref:FAD-binding PCMH-type domain-containing protein n=1 Tax=Coptis chinensis TaxID=261450 RepID=A0A835HEH5_9MAGN|nr:hypothetical protein IFM89_013925 [Coptis chinensis]
MSFRSEFEVEAGHDYEGLSHTSQKPFVIIDLIKFRQAGATLGEVYYQIAKVSSTHGFPAGICPTVGIGGHISGGGIGTLSRKYGTAADNILNAYFIDVKGKLHDRKSMGEELFWALRGGGGASFGVIVSWKIKLVSVPSTVTVFNVHKKLEAGVTILLHKRQNVADKFHADLFVRAIIQAVDNETKKENYTSFISVSISWKGQRTTSTNENEFSDLGWKPKIALK